MECVSEGKIDGIGCEDAAGFMSGQSEKPWVVLHLYVGEECAHEVVFATFSHPSGTRVIGSCKKDPICREE